MQLFGVDSGGKINTAYIEHLNLSIRNSLARFERKSMNCSKILGRHTHALDFSRLGTISLSCISHFGKGSINDGKVDAKNTCNGRKNGGSCMDYHGADGIQDAFQ